jgi:predicted aldo/keto reductase-like oxidoreductase
VNTDLKASYWQVSALGFGAMRLPIVGNDQSHIDETEAIQIIRYAFDHCVNYVDAAYSYHGGNSEILVGKVLQNGYRAKSRLATKMSIRRVDKPSDFERIFSEQLQKLARTQSIVTELASILKKSISI